MSTTKDFRGKRVLGGKKGKHKIGKVRLSVFAPTEPRLVGFIVKRPDLLLMIKRKDKFLAYDAFDLVDGRLVINKGNDSWDEAACQRLGIDYDRCIIWENMPITTEDGKSLGNVGQVKFDDETGWIKSVTSADSATSKAILGVFEIPVEYIEGYGRGTLVAKPEAAQIEESGGLAAKAGAGSAKLSHNVSEGNRKAGEKINEGAYAMGGAIGKAKNKIEDNKEAKEKEREESDDGMTSGERKFNQGAYAFGESLGKAKNALSGFAQDVKGASDGDETPADEEETTAVIEADEGDSKVDAGPEKTDENAPKSEKKATEHADSDDEEDSEEPEEKPGDKYRGMFAAFKEEYDKGRKGD